MIESAAYEIIKREGIEEGIGKGVRGSIEKMLDVKFPNMDADIRRKIQQIDAPDRLNSLIEVIILASNPEEVIREVERG